MASPLRSAGLGFSDAPLQQVAQVIEEEYGFPVRLDVPALDEIGIGPDEPVTFSMHGISLRSALRLMLQHLQLTYIIQDEVLFITTPEAADQELRICVYDVREIVGPAKDQSVDELIDAVVACVASETWAENGGGEAEIRWLQPGFLVISQTQAVHEEVHALLATIRDVRKRPSNAAAETADSAAAAAADANRVTTRYYSLKIGESANSEAVRQQVRDLITESLPEERWKGSSATANRWFSAFCRTGLFCGISPRCKKKSKRCLPIAVCRCPKHLPAEWAAVAVHLRKAVGDFFNRNLSTVISIACAQLLYRRPTMQMGPTLAEYAYEIVIDGLDQSAVTRAMRAAGEGILATGAGNYGGKLGRFPIKLHELFA